jgi:hypothetical protein
MTIIFYLKNKNRSFITCMNKPIFFIEKNYFLKKETRFTCDADAFTFMNIMYL